MDCGVCCLKMITTFYNRNYHIETLRKITSAGVDGVSLLGISKAAEQIGFKTMGGLISIQCLISKGILPCILHWEQNHFVVLYKIKKTKKNVVFCIADPEKGLLAYGKEEFVKCWESTKRNGEELGVALFMEPTEIFYTKEDEANYNRGKITFLYEYFKKYKRCFLQISCGLLIGCLVQLLFPFLTQSIVDVGIGDNDVSFIWLILSAQFALLLGQFGLDFIRRRILLHVSTRINISLISDSFIKLMKLPMKFFEEIFDVSHAISNKRIKFTHSIFKTFIMKTHVFFLTMILFSTNVLSQVEIKKVVVDSQKLPLTGAVVTCLDKNDKLLRGSITDANGIFSISANFTQKEWLRVSHLGYENQDFNGLALLPDTIVMKERSEELGEVVIQGKSFVTQKSDRLVFNIANPNLTKGNNTFHLLSFTPLIQVDREQISVLGKSGIKLYINGRKTLLSGESMLGYLKSLPAESISKIEIITDPGSEYKAGSDEGIVNLVLKKDESTGWKGTLTMKDAQGIYNSPEGNLYLDYQKGKHAVSISAYAKKNKERYDKEGEYDYMDSGFTNQIEETTRLRHKFYGMNFNWDYQLNEKQIIGLMADISYAKKHNGVYSTTVIKKPNDESFADSLVYMPNIGDNERFQASGNANYRLTTDKKGSKLMLDLDFVRTIDDNESILDYSNVVTETIKDPFLSIKQKTDNSFSTWSGAASYNHKFSSAHQIKIGTDIYFLKSYNDFFHGELKNSEYISDPLKSNIFDATENYWGAYFTSINRWNDKFTTNLGIRSEYLHRKGEQKVNSETREEKDFAVLPSISLNYTPNGSHNLSFSLRTSKIRPYLTQLNSFRYYLTPTLYRENNPDLESIYSFTSSLQYVLKSHYIFRAVYMTKGIMSDFRRPMEGGYTQIETHTFGRQHTGIWGFSWNNSFFKNSLSVNATCEGVWERAYGTFETLRVDVNDFSYQMFLNATWTIPFVNKMSIGTFFRYVAAKKQAAFKSNENYGLSFWGQKGFGSGISLRFGVDNLLSSKSKRIYTTSNYYSIENTDFNFRRFYLQITIPFGRKKVAGAEWHERSSSIGKNRIILSN